MRRHDNYCYVSSTTAVLGLFLHLILLNNRSCLAAFHLRSRQQPGTVPLEQKPQPEHRSLYYTVGCPKNQLCKSPTDFPLDALESDSSCWSSADCHNNEYCRFVPTHTDGGPFSAGTGSSSSSSGFFCCEDVAQGMPGVYDVCTLDCVEHDDTVSGGAASSSSTSTPPATATTTTTSVTLCKDVKTCTSLVSIIDNVSADAATALLANPECTNVGQCPLGECRHDAANNALVCDDAIGTHCGKPCVDDDRSSRSIAIGDGDGGTSSSNEIVRGVDGAVPAPCQSWRLCDSLVTIATYDSSKTMQQLVFGAECVKVDDCDFGECRYHALLDKLVCDDSEGTYCDLPCVEDDRIVASLPTEGVGP